MRKRLLALAVLVSLAAGCGRDDSGGGAAAEAVKEGKATGEITVWAMGTEGEKLAEFAKAFTAEDPEAKVSVTAVPWDSAQQKISSAIAAKQTPTCR